MAKGKRQAGLTAEAVKLLSTGNDGPASTSTFNDNLDFSQRVLRSKAQSNTNNIATMSADELIFMVVAESGEEQSQQQWRRTAGAMLESSSEDAAEFIYNVREFFGDQELIYLIADPSIASRTPATFEGAINGANSTE